MPAHDIKWQFDIFMFEYHTIRLCIKYDSWFSWFIVPTSSILRSPRNCKPLAFFYPKRPQTKPRNWWSSRFFLAHSPQNCKKFTSAGVNVFLRTPQSPNKKNTYPHTHTPNKKVNQTCIIMYRHPNVCPYMSVSPNWLETRSTKRCQAISYLNAQPVIPVKRTCIATRALK